MFIYIAASQMIDCWGVICKNDVSCTKYPRKKESKNDNKISLKSKNLKREKVFKENEFFEKEVKNNLDIRTFFFTS